MKKILLSILFTSVSFFASAQIMVNKEDLNQVTDSFELYSAIKPFTTEECVFIDYGQDKFRPNNYDLKDVQAIYDKDGNKFKKGDYRKATKYIESHGWKVSDKRVTKIGTIDANVTIYEKIKE